MQQTSLQNLPLLVVALTMGLGTISCTTTEAKKGYCENCLTQTARQKLQGSSAPALYQQATQLALQGQKAEREKRFGEAFLYYTRAVANTERLEKEHPKSTSALKLKNNPQLASITLSSIKLDKIPKLRQQSLISSGVLGWAQYSIEDIKYESSRTDPMMHLAEIYAELGEHYKAKQILATLDAIVPHEERNWQRKRIKKIEQYMSTHSTQYNAKVIAALTGCVLSPGVCHVMRQTKPMRIIAPLMPPTLHQSNSLNRWARSSRVTELLRVNNHTAALRYAMMTPEFSQKMSLLLDIARHGRREKNQAIQLQAEDLYGFLANTVVNKTERIATLRKMYWYNSSDKKNKAKTLQTIKNIRDIAATIEDPLKRMKEQARVAREFAYQKDNASSKALLATVMKTYESTKIAKTRDQDSIVSSVASTLEQLEDFDTSLIWYQKLSKKKNHTYLYARIQKGFVKQGKSADLSLFKEGEPNSSKTSSLINLAKEYAKQGKKKEALELAKFIEVTLNEREEAKKDTWSIPSQRISMIEIYALAKNTKKVNEALNELFKKAKANPKNRSSALRAYAKLLRLTIEQNNKKLYKKVYAALRDEIRNSTSYYNVGYAIRTALSAYLERRQYKDMFKLIEAISRDYYRTRAIGEISQLYMKQKPKDRDPKIPARLIALVNSYANKSYDATGAFHQLTIMCADPKIKCTGQLIQMAKDLDKRSKNQYSRALSSLAYQLSRQGQFKQSLALVDDIARDYNKAQVLSDIARNWGRKKSYRATHPNIMDDITAKAKTLSQSRQMSIQAAMMTAYANSQQCDKIIKLIDDIKKNKKNRYYNVYGQERAATMCMLQGDVTTAMKIANGITSPYNRARAILQLGYYIDGSGYASHPDVQKILKQVAFETYTKKKTP